MRSTPRADTVARREGRPFPSVVAVCLAVSTMMPAASAGAPAVVQGEPLVVVSWGGAYEAIQRRVFFEPFTRHTGIPVTVVEYAGGLSELRHQHASADVRWDVLDMTMSDTIAACAEGLLQRLSPALPAPSPEGVPPQRDFIDGAFTECGITHTVYATVIAYDRRAFPGVRPDSVEALFDTKRFPGRRALQRAPFGNLEWALLSYGVPRVELYDLLSTARGLRLAFDRLARIAGEAVWWRAGDVPPALLATGEVAMATGYNGRFFHAIATEAAPIEIIWDGQIQEYETWAVARGSSRSEAARAFIRFATATRRLAEFSRHIPYGPARRSAYRRVTEHPSIGIDMQPHLPTHPFNARNAVIKDVHWYARTYDRIRERFAAWYSRHHGEAPAASPPRSGASPQP